MFETIVTIALVVLVGASLAGVVDSIYKYFEDKYKDE